MNEYRPWPGSQTGSRAVDGWAEDGGATMATQAMTATEAPQTGSHVSETRPYFVNVWVDGFFLGGLSIIFFVYLRFGVVFLDQNSGAETASFFGQSAARWAVLAFWVLNWPHFAATSYRLYRSKETVTQYPVIAFGVPIIVGLGALLALANPESFAPWFVKLFFIWSPYHFSGQTIGLTLLYARRAGFAVTPLLRWSLTWFVFATCADVQARSELPGVVVTFGDVVIPAIGIPAWVASFTNFAVLALGAVLIMAIIDATQRSGGRFPVILVIPALAQLTWFKLAVGTWETRSYVEFVNLFHSIQYLFIAWFMQMKERQILTGEEGSRSRLFKETALWGLLIFIIGVFMFRGSARLVSAVSPVSLGVSLAVMTAMFQLHHFFVDGVIWKLRNPRIRGSLNTSLGDLMTRRSSS